MTNSYLLGLFDWQPMVIELDSAPPTDPWWVTRPEPGVSSQSQGPALPYCAVREEDGEREKSNEGLSISEVFNYLHSGPCPTCSLMPADTTNNCQTDDRQIKQSTPVESKGRSSSSVVIFLSTQTAHPYGLQKYGSFIAGQGKSMLTISSKLQLLATWQWVNAITTSPFPGRGLRRITL